MIAPSTPLPTPVAVVATATSAPVASPTPRPPAGVSDEVQVRQLIAEFARAIEEKDVALYKRLRPTLSDEDERKLRTAFDNVRSQEVRLNIDNLTLESNKAGVDWTVPAPSYLPPPEAFDHP